MNIVIKIIAIIVVFTVGWRHVGMCYINYDLKVIIVCLSAVEILVLIGQIVVMFRKRVTMQLMASIGKGKITKDEGEGEDQAQNSHNNNSSYPSARPLK